MPPNGEETNEQAFDHAFADVLESVSGDPDVFLTAAFSFLMRRSTLSADVLGDGDCAKQTILDNAVYIFGSQVDLHRKNMEREFLKPIDTGMTMHQYDSALQDDVDEFLLIKTPPSLKVLTDLLEEGSNSSSRRRCIWLKPGYSYISSADATDPEIYGYAGSDFWFTCRASSKSSRIDLRRFKIHASSEKELEDNLALIVTIPDTYFESVALIASTDGYTRCPLKEKDLRDFVSSNGDRWTEFRRFSFSRASSHVLAGDKVQKIAFNDCDFYEDGGALFIDTLSAQTRTGRELSKSFRFEKSIPFDWDLWSQFLGLLTGVCELQLVNFKSDLYTTPAPKVDVLVIHNCSFRDDGDALIENIAKDNGPKRLRLLFSSELYQIGSELVFFETESRFCRLMAALSRNARLSELSLEGMILREGCLQGHCDRIVRLRNFELSTVSRSGPNHLLHFFRHFLLPPVLWTSTSSYNLESRYF